MQVGSKTDCALLGFVSTNLSQDSAQIEYLRSLCPNSKFRKVYTLNSERKYMCRVLRLADRPLMRANGNGFIVFVKGASEIILRKYFIYSLAKSCGQLS